MPLAGQVIQAFTVPPSAISASSFTFSNTTPANGTPICGLSFLAPQSGSVAVDCSFDATTQANQLVILGWRMRAGATIGSGVVADGTEPGDGANGALWRRLHSGRGQGGGGTAIVTGLTPGATYNLCTYHYVDTSSPGAASILSRGVTVMPLL